MRRAVPALACAVACAVACLAGCGVQPDASPRALNRSSAPFGVFGRETPAPVEGDLATQMWFVRADRLTPVQRALQRPGSAPQVLQSLFAGPTPGERAAGLSTAIPASVVFRSVDVQGGIAVVTLDGLNEQVQVTAFAQIVETLATRPDVVGVRFRSGDEDVQVPRADGSLTNAPVDRSAYATLLAGAPTPVATPVPATP